MPGSAGEYDIKEVARTRVTGRDTHVITVTPRDQFRYGYRLWIDDSTAMPLKTQLCDSRGRVIEQIVFTSLTLPAHIPEASFEPGLDRGLPLGARRDAEPVDPGASVGRLEGRAHCRRAFT